MTNIAALTEVIKSAINTIEVLEHNNAKLNRLVEAINQRSDVTDDTRRFILACLTTDKEKLN